MPDIEHFGLFVVAGLLLNVMPGPDTFYILARTVNGTIYCMLLVLFASAVIDKFKASQRSTTLLKRATGALFVGLGAKLAVER